MFWPKRRLRWASSGAVVNNRVLSSIDLCRGRRPVTEACDGLGRFRTLAGPGPMWRGASHTHTRPGPGAERFINKSARRGFQNEPIAETSRKSVTHDFVLKPSDIYQRRFCDVKGHCRLSRRTTAWYKVHFNTGVLGICYYGVDMGVSTF